MYLTGIILGLSSSLHCIGMCGPLAAALPRGTGSSGRLIGSRLLYQTGRICTYALLGTLAGGVGYSVHALGWQRNLYLLTGLIMVLSLLVGTLFARSRSAQKYTGWISRLVAHELNHRAGPAYFSIGMLNGLLPCGMVFLALAGAASMGSMQGGALYMALFGLGTLPSMLAVSLAGMMAQQSLRGAFRRLSPVLIIIMGGWFIFRGLQTDAHAAPTLTAWKEKPSCCPQPSPDVHDAEKAP